MGIKPWSHHRLREDSLTPMAFATCFGETVLGAGETGFWSDIPRAWNISMNVLTIFMSIGGLCQWKQILILEKLAKKR